MSGGTWGFDVETDGLLQQLTRIHCLWMENAATGERLDFADQPGHRPIREGLAIIEGAAEVFGHNIIDFDLRAIEKVYPEFKRPARCLDTIILAKLLWPSERLWDSDYKLVLRGALPQRLAKRYSLEAWGWRFGERKSGYDGGWEVWTPAMHQYCGQDVATQMEVWRRFQEQLNASDFQWPDAAVMREMYVQDDTLEQQRVGFGFNRDKAIALTASLQNRVAEIERSLVETFGSWWADLGEDEWKGTSNRKLTQYPDITRRRFSDKTGKELKPYVGPPMEHQPEGARFTRVERTTFNPKSRQHLAERLITLYGWKPTAFGGKEGTTPTLDEGTLKALPAGLIPDDLKALLQEFFVTDKTLAMVSAGRKAWLRMDGMIGRDDIGDGRMHGGMDILGTNTGRGIHKEPNLSQVPSVLIAETKDAAGKVILKEPVKGYPGKFGWECRDLFVPRPGWEQSGTDVASLELAELGHYLVPRDGGRFAAMMSDPAIDPHEANGSITGLTRKDTKTVTYAYLFGAGPLLVGAACGFEPEEADDLLTSPELKNYLRWMRKRDGDKYRVPDRQTQCHIAKGARVIQMFEAGVTGLKDLKADLQATVKGRGWLRSIGGRRIWIKKPHLALNYLLQGGGADICKEWQVLIRQRLEDEGHERGKDWNRMGWFHDELQFEHRPGLALAIAEASQWAIAEAGTRMGFRVALRTETKVGKSWAECH